MFSVVCEFLKLETARTHVCVLKSCVVMWAVIAINESKACGADHRSVVRDMLWQLSSRSVIFFPYYHLHQVSNLTLSRFWIEPYTGA